VSETLRESVATATVSRCGDSGVTVGSDFVILCPHCGAYQYTLTLTGHMTMRVPCRNRRCGRAFTARRESILTR
jgi:hypothetical protein